MKYLMLITSDESGHVDPADVPPIEPWLADLDRRGAHLAGDRLRPTSDATTVRVRAGETLVVDGPYAETKEQICGFDVIECADLDEAIEIASRHPVATFGSIEVRPFWTE